MCGYEDPEGDRERTLNSVVDGLSEGWGGGSGEGVPVDQVTV